MILSEGTYIIDSWATLTGKTEWQLTLTKSARLKEYIISERRLVNRRHDIDSEYNNPAGTYIIYINKQFKVIETDGKFNFVLLRDKNGTTSTRHEMDQGAIRKIDC